VDLCLLQYNTLTSWRKVSTSSAWPSCGNEPWFYTSSIDIANALSTMCMLRSIKYAQYSITRICTYWLSGRAGRENIWLEARASHPDREPNIFPSGPTLLSQQASYHMTTYFWKFWKFCLNLNRTRLHKIRRLRARNNDMKITTTKICQLFLRVQQETHNSLEKHDSCSHFCSSIAIHAEKPTESWHKAVKNMSRPSKT